MNSVGILTASLPVVIEAIRYPDHHDYGMLEMQYISERAISKEVVAMVTTIVFSNTSRPSVVFFSIFKKYNGIFLLK